MSTTTIPATRVSEQSDETLIFTAQSLKIIATKLHEATSDEYELGLIYWEIIDELRGRYPAAFDASVAVGWGNKRAIDAILPFIQAEQA